MARMNSRYFFGSGEDFLTNYSVSKPSMECVNHQGQFHCDVSSCMPQCSPSLQHLDRFQRGNFPSSISRMQYCTLESSPCNATHDKQPLCISSAHSSSPDGSDVSQQDSQISLSDIHHSPNNTHDSSVVNSFLTEEEENDLALKLRELERVMLGSDLEYSEMSGNFLQRHVMFEPEAWKGIQRGGLRNVLIACAKAIVDENLVLVESLVEQLKQMVSVSGEPIHRVGAYMLEGLVARMASSGGIIYKSLKCKDPTSSDLLSYMHTLYEICPYFKFGYLSANGAIAEALKGEDRVHIIDFQISQGAQWITLIQALAARHGGPPHVRITGIDDARSAYARGGGMQLVEERLSRLANSCNVPFEFNATAVSGCDVEAHMLKVRSGEAIAVNFPFQLHHMPDESVSTINHRDRLLRMVKSLSPKVVTLVEQECNANTAPFFTRFVEALNYYTAMFESIDITLPRESKDRIDIEQQCLAGEIVNILACEGAERVERHELLEKWRSRFSMAGFRPYPLSSLVNATIKTLLQSYCRDYTLDERDDTLYLGWKNKTLVTSCAWH